MKRTTSRPTPARPAPASLQQASGNPAALKPATHKPATLKPPMSGATRARLIVTGKVKLARAMGVLVRTHPFHGHIAAGWTARPEQGVPTMGVGWACGGVQLVWNPEFVDRISELELAGVLLHEVHHVALRHPFLFPEQADPPPDFDAFAAIVAEEITVNEFVTLPLPGSPMLLENFKAMCPSLEPLESTRERYRKLYDPARARRDHEERQQLVKTIEQQLEKQLDQLLAGGHGVGQLPDSHAGWGSFQRGGAAAALAVSVATAQAMAKHGSSLSAKLRELIERAHAVAGGPPGSTPGGTLEQLAGTARARLSWQKILRRLLAVDHVAEPTYLRPPRRFPELVGVLPGSRRVPTRLKILAAIDTSGSMSAATLDEIAAELRVMAKSYDVAVVEFDATIQRRYRIGPAHVQGSGGDPLNEMQGRGGTSFHPIFEPETLTWAGDGSDLSGVVVFTDGYGPAPDRPPSEPVIWVLMGTASGHAGGGGIPGFGVRRPATWGTVVYAHESAS
jgi:predicted metal-dependent peptidase